MRGFGVLSAEQQDEALGMIAGGARQTEVAKRFGVTKNVIAGLWSRHGDPTPLSEPSTLEERCAALHARMDAVLAETMGVGKIVEGGG